MDHILVFTKGKNWKEEEKMKLIVQIAGALVTVPVLGLILLVLVAVSVGIMFKDMACHIWNNKLEPFINN